MTATTEQTRTATIAANLAAVEQHFHNENPDGIDLAVRVYTDDIVWEIPARGLVLRDKETVKREYLKMFGAMQVHQITNLHRFATEDWVFDDSIFEITLLTEGFRNCPFPPGTHCSLRLIHAFEMRDGKICRENGYEIWRRADDTARVNDLIPAGAQTQVFPDSAGSIS